MSHYYNRPPYYYHPRYPYYYGGYPDPFLGSFFGGLAGSLLTPIFYGRPPYYRYY